MKSLVEFLTEAKKVDIQNLLNKNPEDIYIDGEDLVIGDQTVAELWDDGGIDFPKGTDPEVAKAVIKQWIENTGDDWPEEDDIYIMIDGKEIDNKYNKSNNDNLKSLSYEKSKNFLEKILNCKLIPSEGYSVKKQEDFISNTIDKNKDEEVKISIFKDGTMDFSVKGRPIDFVNKQIGFDYPEYTIEDLESIKKDFVKAMNYIIKNSKCPSNWEQNLSY